MPLKSNNSFRELLRAREIIGDCYRKPLRLEDAADTIFLSPWHFQREFQRAFGETPHQFVTRLRIAQSKELLARTDSSVQQICVDVGFSSLGSFSALFKRHVGVSPGRYRRHARKVISVKGVRDLVCIPFCFAGAWFPNGHSEHNLTIR